MLCVTSQKNQKHASGKSVAPTAFLPYPSLSENAGRYSGCRLAVLFNLLGDTMQHRACGRQNPKITIVGFRDNSSVVRPQNQKNAKSTESKIICKSIVFSHPCKAGAAGLLVLAKGAKQCACACSAQPQSRIEQSTIQWPFLVLCFAVFASKFLKFHPTIRAPNKSTRGARELSPAE